MALAETSYVLETTLNIPASDMIMPIDDVIIRHLTKRYVGYCERRCLVVSVKKIIQRSSLRMSKARLDGSGDISVRFEVSGNVLRPRDLLVGCVIKNITGNNVTCVHPKVTITLDAAALARRLQVGNAITTEVTDSSYPQGSETITASGIVYHNLPRTVLYDTQYPVKAPTSPELLQLLQRSLARLTEIRRNFQAAPAERRDYFQSIYYNFDSPMSESALPKGVSMIHASDLAMELCGKNTKNKIGNYGDGERLVLISHCLADPAAGTIFQVDPKLIETNPIRGPEIFSLDDKDLRPTYVCENLIQLLGHLMDQESRYLSMLTEMAHYYLDEAVFKRNDRIWTIMESRRLPQPLRAGKKTAK